MPATHHVHHAKECGSVGGSGVAPGDLSRSQMQTSVAEKQQPKIQAPVMERRSWDGKFTLESKLSESFRSGAESHSLKLKIASSDPKSIKEHGSVFAIRKVKKGKYL